MEHAAPHLVELHPDQRLTTLLLEQTWGQSWGSFLHIKDPSNLRHHLRKFLKVREVGGRTPLFRYFDPRLLRAFLPTCDHDRLRELFGPIHSVSRIGRRTGADEMQVRRRRLGQLGAGG